MAIERLKFRCYRCNQLLAAVPSKAGTVVPCPKCQTDLLIPGAEPRIKGDRESRARSELELPEGTEASAGDQVDARALPKRLSSWAQVRRLRSQSHSLRLWERWPG